MVGFDVEASPLEIPELERYSGDWASICAAVDAAVLCVPAQHDQVKSPRRRAPRPSCPTRGSVRPQTKNYCTCNRAICQIE